MEKTGAILEINQFYLSSNSPTFYKGEGEVLISERELIF